MADSHDTTALPKISNPERLAEIHMAAPCISALSRDPALAEIFRRAEDEGMAPAEIDRPAKPRQDGAAAERILEMA